MAVTPTTSFTLMTRLPGNVAMFGGTGFQACKGHVLKVKQGCLLERNRKLSTVDFTVRHDVQSSLDQRRNMCLLFGRAKPCNPQAVSARKFALWGQPDFIPDLQRFLSEIGTDPKEARFWLKQFLNVNQQKPFAVIEVGSEVFTQTGQLEQLASAVSFLQRNSLRPVLVFGNAPASGTHRQMSFQEMNSASVSASCALCKSLENQGVQAKVLYAGSNTILAAECGRVKAVNPELVQWCMVQQAIPIIPAFGETTAGQILPLETWDVTSAVAIKLQPLKVIKVNCSGGFKDERQQVIANVNLPFDISSVKDKTWCTESVVEMIGDVSELLTQVPEHTAVVITAADKVLQELFTHRGSGTFLKLTEPIHKSFRKLLCPTYFHDIKNLIHTVYLSERYTAAAVILKLPECDIPYLCKFAVSAQAQGEGTGEILWDAIHTNFKQLFWRSRGSNPVNQWYFRKSEGSWSNGNWTVFWYGIPEPSLSSVLIRQAILAPESFSAPSTGPQKCDSLQPSTVA
ncbi:hypothetical protein BaRGS_00035820 [Batillaria attramentaria]|uniref:N-acetyltransferase domain-containing protein n=1 Tax=Batillaria attramentaria TaxID=370345 RepID=A0ABD0JDC9_9CAEN